MKKILTYLFLALAVCLQSCINDENFSADPNNKLYWYEDRLDFDTIFAEVPSSTRSLWIHNYNTDGIHISNIRLQGGNQNGFRVNVNGMYLSPEKGYQIQNEDIRWGDSIRVFAEITSPQLQSGEKRTVEDNIIFTLESGVEQMLPLKAVVWNAKRYDAREITEDFAFDDDDVPAVIFGKIKVAPEATLTIPAGKTLYFQNGAGIECNGRLVCNGTPSQFITLRTIRLDNMFDYLPYDMVPGLWDGIVLGEKSHDNEITYTDLHSAKHGIRCLTSDEDADAGNVPQKLTISNSIVHNNQGNGIYCYRSNVSIENCQLTNAYDDCLSVWGGNVTVNSSTLAQFTPFTSYAGSALGFYDKLGDVKCPLNLTMRNCIVTGYADDVISSLVDDGDKYYFENCLLRTPVVSDEAICKDIIWEDPKDVITGGDKNFKLINHDFQRYDFHLSEVSRAINAANPETAPETDLQGNPRADEAPDLGCYEFVNN